jgi:hypothetical protein
MVKILSLAMKNGQNIASGGKKGLIILKNVTKGGPPRKNASGPPGL